MSLHTIINMSATSARVADFRSYMLGSQTVVCAYIG